MIDIKIQHYKKRTYAQTGPCSDPVTCIGICSSIQEQCHSLTVTTLTGLVESSTSILRYCDRYQNEKWYIHGDLSES